MMACRQWILTVYLSAAVEYIIFCIRENELTYPI